VPVTHFNFKLLAGLVLLMPLSSCLTGNLMRIQRNDVVPAGASADWVIGATTLTECLDQLGAPLDVWAEPNGGILMAWYGSDNSGWSLTFSAPVGQALDVSASYTDVQEGDEGVVLFFDADLNLTRWVEGKVAVLVREKARPTLEE
jgi:hypothetical protein